MLDKLKSISEWFEDQAWIQELKAKWEELDTTTRKNLSLGSGIGGVLLLIGGIVWVASSVSALKHDYQDRVALLNLLLKTSAETRSLGENLSELDTDTGDANERTTKIKAQLQQAATQAGIDPNTVDLKSEKSLGTQPASTPGIKEQYVQLEIKKINIKQVLRFAVHLENESSPMRLRLLSIDTLPDASGFLNATLTLSSFRERK